MNIKQFLGSYIKITLILALMALIVKLSNIPI